MRLRFLSLVVVLLASAASASAHSDDAPAWLREAAALTTPPYEKSVPAVTLVDNATVTIGDDGKVNTVYNFAVRILRHEGRAYAVGRVGYIPDSGKVRELQAWLMRSNGQIKHFGKDDTLDVAGAPNDVYEEYRVKKISASDEAEAGAVFGYTYTTEERSVFSQEDWAFQGSIPVISSRYSLVLPPGWHANAVTFNHAPIEPKVTGTTYTWELTNLGPVPEEPLSPSLSNLVARLAVSY